MSRYSLRHLPDSALLHELRSLVSQDRATTALLIAHLGEVDARRLYAPAGYPSMFEYCVGELRFSEDIAYKRIHSRTITTGLRGVVNYAPMTRESTHLEAGEGARSRGPDPDPARTRLPGSGESHAQANPQRGPDHVARESSPSHPSRSLTQITLSHAKRRGDPGPTTDRAGRKVGGSLQFCLQFLAKKSFFSHCLDVSGRMSACWRHRLRP